MRQHEHDRGQRMVRVTAQSRVCMTDRGGGVAAPEIQTREPTHGAGDCAAVPACLIIGVIGLIHPLLLLKNETKQIVWVAALHVHVEFRQTGKTAAGIALRLVEPPHLTAVFRHAEQAPGVIGIPFQALQPVGVRHHGGVAVLLDMHARQIQLVCRAQLGGKRHGILHRGLFQMIGALLGVLRRRAAAGGDADGDECTGALPVELYRCTGV